MEALLMVQEQCKAKVTVSAASKKERKRKKEEGNRQLLYTSDNTLSIQRQGCMFKD